MPCRLVKVNHHFGGLCHLHLYGWRVSQVRNQHEDGSDMFLQKQCCLIHVFLLGLLLNPYNGGNIFLWNISWLSKAYMELFPRRYNSS
jgi:hypothetical protein